MMRLGKKLLAIVAAVLIVVATVPVPPAAAKPAPESGVPCASHGAAMAQGGHAGHAAGHDLAAGRINQEPGACADCASGAQDNVTCDQDCFGAAALDIVTDLDRAVFDPADLPGHAPIAPSGAPKPGLHPPAA